MTTAEIRKRLEADYPELLTADGFDDAILGVASGWFGDSHHEVICYDYAKCVAILVAQGFDEEEAEEYLQFNTLGAYVGEFTPVFLYRWRGKKGPLRGFKPAERLAHELDSNYDNQTQEAADASKDRSEISI